MTKEKTLNGVKFTAAPFTAVEGLKLKSYLVRTFGPALGEALGSFKDLFRDGAANGDQIGDVSIDGQSIARAIEKLMEQLSEPDFIALIKRLFSNVTAQVPGTEKGASPVLIGFGENAFDASMELAFAGRLFSVYPVIVLVLGANYPDFFEKMAGTIGSKIKAIVTSGPANSSGPTA
jgi:hypothetical protein